MGMIAMPNGTGGITYYPTPNASGSSGPNPDDKAWKVGDAARATVDPAAMASLVRERERARTGVRFLGGVAGAALGSVAGAVASGIFVAGAVSVAPIVALGAAGAAIGYAAGKSSSGSDEHITRESKAEADERARAARSTLCGGADGILLEASISPKALGQWRQAKSEVCGSQPAAQAKPNAPGA